MKTCFKCDRRLSLDEFYKHPMMADGHLGKCKECTRVDVQANYWRRHEQYRAYDRGRNSLPHRVQKRLERSRSDAGKTDRRLRTLSFRIRYPEKYAAHTAVSNAIRNGRLKRLSCEICGNAKAEGHHDDYSKPLAVRWLCKQHHDAHHREEKAS